MTLYTVTWTARPSPYHHPRQFRQWAGSMEAARKAVRVIQGPIAAPAQIEQVVVPIGKAGLIAFLNAQYEPRRIEP